MVPSGTAGAGAGAAAGAWAGACAEGEGASAGMGWVVARGGLAVSTPGTTLDIVGAGAGGLSHLHPLILLPSLWGSSSVSTLSLFEPRLWQVASPICFSSEWGQLSGSSFSLLLR